MTTTIVPFQDAVGPLCFWSQQRSPGAPACEPMVGLLSYARSGLEPII
jgi:hypothetical protein